MADEDELDAIWAEHRPLTVERLDVISGAARAAAAGSLGARARQAAGAEAHTIAGAAAIFGFTEGARLAREIERTLKAEHALSEADGERLVALSEALRSELDRPRSSR